MKLWIILVTVPAGQEFFSLSATKAPARRSQHLKETYHNIVGRYMLHAFGQIVATNRTSERVEAQHSNLAKRLQQHAASTNVA